jgi:hypothetical protein
LKEDYEHNRRIAIPNWFNPNSDQYDSCYYDVNKQNSQGDYDDTIYVMDNDDCFDLVEYPTINIENDKIQFAIDQLTEILEKMTRFEILKAENTLENLQYKIQDLKQRLR